MPASSSASQATSSTLRWRRIDVRRFAGRNAEERCVKTVQALEKAAPAAGDFSRHLVIRVKRAPCVPASEGTSLTPFCLWQSMSQNASRPGAPGKRQPIPTMAIGVRLSPRSASNSAHVSNGQQRSFGSGEFPAVSVHCASTRVEVVHGRSRLSIQLFKFHAKKCFRSPVAQGRNAVRGHGPELVTGREVFGQVFCRGIIPNGRHLNFAP